MPFLTCAMCSSWLTEGFAAAPVPSWIFLCLLPTFTTRFSRWRGVIYKRKVQSRCRCCFQAEGDTKTFSCRALDEVRWGSLVVFRRRNDNEPNIHCAINSTNDPSAWIFYSGKYRHGWMLARFVQSGECAGKSGLMNVSEWVNIMQRTLIICCCINTPQSLHAHSITQRNRSTNRDKTSLCIFNAHFSLPPLYYSYISNKMHHFCPGQG